MPQYVLAKDIVIQAGTKVGIGPTRRSTGRPSASIILGPSKDMHAEWFMDLEDAIEVGLVTET